MTLVAKNSTKLTACLPFVLALFSGGIGILAYSPFDYWIVAFLSASGLIWLTIYHSTRTALMSVFLWALSYFAIGVSWVQVSMIQFGGVPEFVSYVAVLLLAAYLAIYPLLFAYLVQRFQVKNPWLLASLFTLTEYLRGVVFTGFPWLQFGYSLIDTPFAHLATIFGVEGLTFFVILVSAYVVKIGHGLVKKSFDLTACIIASLAIILTYSTQFLRFVQVNEEKAALTISLIQGNIEQKMKWDPAYFNDTLQTYQHLLSQVIGRSDVIILPESAIPATEEQIQPLMQQLDNAARVYGSHIIIGTLYQNATGLYNSALTLGGEQPYHSESVSRYNKHHLVPFGEYVPFGNLLDWMREVFILPINLSQGDFIQPPISAKGDKFNMAICYEIIFGHQLQQNQQAHAADYLLTISNDAWFGTSRGPWQHFQMARMRALELGKPLIRATNTGVTAFVDFEGQISSVLPQFQTDILTHTVQPTKGETLYAQFGRGLLYGLCSMIMLFSVIRRMTSKNKI